MRNSVTVSLMALGLGFPARTFYIEPKRFSRLSPCGVFAVSVPRLEDIVVSTKKLMQLEYRSYVFANEFFCEHVEAEEESGRTSFRPEGVEYTLAHRENPTVTIRENRNKGPPKVSVPVTPGTTRTSGGISGRPVFGLAGFFFY